MILGFCSTSTLAPISRFSGRQHLLPPTGTFLERQNYNIPGGRHKLNPSQNRAIRSALEKQFTVIQGPPGGVRLQKPGTALGRQVWP